MSNVYTASTVIAADPERVFEYVRVPENQTAWAVNFVRSTEPVGDGRYVMETPVGRLTYRVVSEERQGVVDFVFDGPGEPVMPGRVVRHAKGSIYMLTITRAPGMPEADWERGCLGLDEELEELKRILEATTPASG